MLTKEVAVDIIPLVNDPEYYDMLQGYTEYRIEQLHKQLEQSVDINAILRIQGSISELRRFALLKEEAIADSRKK